MSGHAPRNWRPTFSNGLIVLMPIAYQRFREEMRRDSCMINWGSTVQFFECIPTRYVPTSATSDQSLLCVAWYNSKSRDKAHYPHAPCNSVNVLNNAFRPRIAKKFTRMYLREVVDFFPQIATMWCRLQEMNDLRVFYAYRGLFNVLAVTRKSNRNSALVILTARNWINTRDHGSWKTKGTIISPLR